MFPALQALADRGARDPMEVVEDPAQRALAGGGVARQRRSRRRPRRCMGAIVSLQQRQIESELRDLRAQIAEAERRGDFAELAVLTQRKLELDRALTAAARRPGDQAQINELRSRPASFFESL